jgi:hypothetical protein
MTLNSHVLNLRTRWQAARDAGLFDNEAHACIDWFSFSSDQVYPLFLSDRKILSISARPNQWYHHAIEVFNLYVNYAPKTPKHKEYSYRIKSDNGMLEDFLYLDYDLPIDGITSRLDICIDCFTFDTALSFVTQKNIYSNQFSYIASPIPELEDELCYTFNFGNRKKSLIFERVYYKPELKKWRYEAEFKPKSNNGSRGVGKKHFAQLAKSVQDLYTLVHSSYTENFPETDLTTFDPVTRSERVKLLYFSQLFLNAPQHQAVGTIGVPPISFFNLAKHHTIQHLAFIILNYSPIRIDYKNRYCHDFITNPVDYDALAWFASFPPDLNHDFLFENWHTIYKLYYNYFNNQIMLDYV